MRPTLFSAAFLALAFAVGPAGADPASTVERLKSDLLGPHSATEVLTQWCGDLRLANPAIIRAMRDAKAFKKPTKETRALLRAKTRETIRYRQVKLMCGSHVLSEADNWYLPARLTPEMNKALDETDMPFGTVVRPLHFTRTTLDAKPGETAPLRVRAVLRNAAGLPFSLVIENYQSDLISMPKL